MLISVIIATVISGVISLMGAVLLSRKKSWEETFSLQLTAFAAGVMLSASLLHLLPEAIENLEPVVMFSSVLSAIVSFYLLESLLFWFHHHHDTHGPKPAVWLITIGDSIHNFIDGMAIAAAFMVDPRLGIITTVAVAVHEIPQEIADFVTMISAGLSKSKALKLNILSALVSVLGGVLTIVITPLIEVDTSLVVAFSAGMFLYIALSDLIPELHRHAQPRKPKWMQTSYFILGILIMYFTATTVDSLLPHEENSNQNLNLTTNDE